MKRTVRAALVPFVLLLLLVRVARGDEWDPGHTYVLLAMVSEWADKKIDSLPKPGNVERRLEAALRKDGVPDGNVVAMTNEEVTKTSLRDALVDQAKNAPRGSTLIFYYTGHGWRDGHGTVSLVTNDADSKHLTETGLKLADVEAIYEKYGWGKKILFLGDYCYSGALDKVVKKLGAKGIDAAALASAPALNQSSANWTFTNTIIDALNGDGSVAKDGVVTLTSLEHAARDAMHFVENQSMEFTRTKGFDQDFVLRKVDPSRVLRHVDGPYQLKDYVDAKARDGEFHRAQIEDEKSGRYLIRYVDSEDDLQGKEQWLPTTRLRVPHVRWLDVGTKVKTYDGEDGGWWSAVVKEAREGFARVTYDELPRTFDQWIPTSDLRVPRSPSKSLESPERAATKDAAKMTDPAPPGAAADPSTLAFPLGPRSSGITATLGERIDEATAPREDR